VVEVLCYVQARLSAVSTIHAAQEIRRLQGVDESNVGIFLNLNCGHNNPFSNEEKRQLKFWLERAVNTQSEVV
jgi:hypothetical protein